MILRLNRCLPSVDWNDKDRIPESEVRTKNGIMEYWNVGITGESCEAPLHTGLRHRVITRFIRVIHTKNVPG